MRDVRNIVVGIDDSVAAAHALDWALAEAASTDRHLRVIHVWSPVVWAGAMPGYGFALPSFPTDLRPAAQAVLDEQVSKALSRRASGAPVTLQSDLIEGDPARVLTEAARKASLVVVGGRGHGQLTSALLGSATNFVLHHAPCPVMVVPGTVGPGERVRRVVIGVDGSPASHSALAWGADAARRHGCSVVAMHVCESTLPPGRGVLLGGPDPSELLAEARTGLEELVADHRSTGVDVTTHVVAGSATGALIEFCHSDDLLVLGSRGLGGFKALVLGSVATQVTHHAHGPVVVVREGEERLVG